MMKSLIPFILSTITVICFQNCGQPFADVQYTNRPPPFVTDPTFNEYIESFESYHKASVMDIPIGFSDLEPKIAGVCYRTIYNGTMHPNYILIDRKYWPTMSEYQKTNLIFHELGHCALNREHVTPDGVSLCPKSFMDPTIMSTDCLVQHFEDYIKEMFP